MTKPTFDDDVVIAALTAAAQKGLESSRQGDDDLNDPRWRHYTLREVEALIVARDCWTLHKHEVDRLFPKRYEYAVIVKMTLPIRRWIPWYVKVSLYLPDLQTGKLVSYHPWGGR
jgi:hypothetical protein